jgi:hypothetical protein
LPFPKPLLNKGFSFSVFFLCSMSLLKIPKPLHSGPHSAYESLPEPHRSVLQRPTRALQTFTDTSRNGEDFDAELTTLARHLLLDQHRFYGIGGDPAVGAYAADLVTRLEDGIRSDITAAIERANRGHHVPHSNILTARNFLEGSTLRCILNVAPRKTEHRVSGQNGHDFYLGVTDNGIEFYTTPLENLRYIRDRILALFRIPTHGHPLFDGDYEQFRSSIIARSNECPEHLELLYTYADREELQTADKTGIFRSPIPKPGADIEKAFTDKFGNIRLHVRDICRTIAQIEDAKTADHTVGLLVPGSDIILPVHLVRSLKEIPSGEFGLYQNVADGETIEGAGYLELVRRVENPNDPQEFRAHQLLQHLAKSPLKSGTPFEVVPLPLGVSLQSLLAA